MTGQHAQNPKSEAGELGRILVLAGGLSHEREVSLRSGRRVATALRERGLDVELVDIGPDLLPALTADPPAVVLPVLHGTTGEDGAIREILELVGLPYVGSRPHSCRLAWDKPIAKTVVAHAGVSTPDWVTLPEATFRDLGASSVLDAVVGRLGLPLVVKPARAGSALGCTVVRSADQLPAAMVACFAYDDTAVLERYVGGTEVAVSVIDVGSGPQVLPPVEIVPDSGVYDYAARYTAGATEFFVPARLPASAVAAATATALLVHTTLGLRDLSRTDLIITPEGVAEFLDVNVAPGLTETSLLPQALRAAGLPTGEVYQQLLTVAAVRGATRAREPETQPSLSQPPAPTR
jgi:D-alanine-D-alanine ligase